MNILNVYVYEREAERGRERDERERSCAPIRSAGSFFYFPEN